MADIASSAAQPSGASSPALPPRGGIAGLTSRPRLLELGLLAFATGLFGLAWLLVDAQQAALTRSSLWVALGYCALLAVAHGAVRLWAGWADPLILPCVAMLNGLGLVMIHRLDLSEAGSSGDAWRQLAWTALGLVGFVVVLWRVRTHQPLARYRYTFGVVGLGLVALPGLLPGSISEVNGAKLWLRLGPVTIQPGEFAKIAIIVFVAAFLVAKRELFTTAGREVWGIRFPRARDLAPLLAAWAAAVVVLGLERELGAALLIYGVILAMIYIATGRVSWLLVGLVSFAGAASIAYQLFGHVRVRVRVWTDPFADATGAGYQASQALFGLGTGGIGGTGLAAGRPELVPLANADYIVASLGEELGLLGLAAVLVVYLILIARGLRAALAVRDSFGKLLASGLALTLAWQLFIVVGGVSNLIPDTGLTTPFLSYGGSSLLANYVLVALLVLISHHAHAPHTPRPSRRTPLSRTTTEIVDRRRR